MLDPREHRMGITVDIENAFNTRSRTVVLEKLFSEQKLQPIRRIAHWAYAKGSKLIVRNKKEQLVGQINSSTGVRQGDPLASLLFAVSMQHLYEKVLRDSDQVYGVAIQDDFTLVGPPACCRVPQVILHAYARRRPCYPE